MKETVAVIGGGVAGVTAAHILQNRFSVDLFEAADYLGGHTNTFQVSSGPDQGLMVDTGFIVFNSLTYPHFERFLGELGVQRQESDMSFGYLCEQTGWRYAGQGLNSLFARRSNLISPEFWRFVFEIVHFSLLNTWKMSNNAPVQGTLRDYLKNYSPAFVQHYIAALGAAIWSTPLEEILDFPASSYLRFFANHGLLNLWRRPQWYTVKGGSAQYLRAFERKFQGRILLKHPVTQLSHNEQGVEFQAGGQVHRYQRAVLATHADISLAMLAHPTGLEQELLGAWRYLGNRAVLHQDLRQMPDNPLLHASWNYRRPLHSNQLPTLTYDMNRLQRLPTSQPYLVTLNPTTAISDDKILGQWIYHHPQFDERSVATQVRLPQLNTSNLAYCGSYHRYGFHEDAVLSAVNAARHWGIEW
jgi:predicted NAD/FAD-binding protein